MKNVFSHFSMKNLPNYGRRHFKLFTDCFVGHPVVELQGRKCLDYQGKTPPTK